MAEAVRFYWLGGEAGLPLDVIPEGDRDRSPLRVHRSVVQTHAPAILAQVEAGRFVAAARPSDAQVTMILCPPHLAPPAETLVLNTPILPGIAKEAS